MNRKRITLFLALVGLCMAICPFMLMANLDWDRAESLFDDSLYEEAISQFEKALENNDSSKEVQHQIQSRLALCHLKLRHPKEALAILDTQSNGDLYLIAVAKRQLGLHEEALEKLTHDLSSPHIRFERGLNYYHLAHWKAAQNEFENISDVALYPLAQLHLARIALYQKLPEVAESHLNQIKISNESILQTEKIYLQGMCYFLNQKFGQAAEEFAKITQNPNSSIYSSATRFFAWSKIKLNSHAPVSTSFLDEAEALLSLSQNEFSEIDLGHFYLIKGRLSNNPAYYQKTRMAIDQLPDASKSFFKGISFLEEGIYYQQSKKPDLAKESLEKALDTFQEQVLDNFTAKRKFYLAITQIYLGKKEAAVELLKALSANKELLADLNHPEKVYYLLALLSTDPEYKKECLQYLYIHYPKSPYAAEAYFNYYTYGEYLQGNRQSIKHLQSLSGLFPDHPLQITVYYLLGLDQTKNRVDEKGHVIRHQNLTAAIESFQKTQSAFDRFKNESLPEAYYSYYRKTAYKAMLERARANLALAKTSQSSKQQIYLKYASEVFEDLSQQVNNQEGPFYVQLSDEANYGLAETYLLQEDIVKADKALNRVIDRHKTSLESKGYLLSRVHYEKGRIALKNQLFTTALESFSSAESSALGLSDDERLDLWIHQSHCCKGMGKLTEAMSLLSKVINEDAVSGLRIKAMLLRAELYDLQGRPELAKKQRETVAKRGGDWR